MSKDWFTADTHFNNEKVLLSAKRPFNTVDEMNRTLVNNWNKTVQNNDTVYHLGDFGVYDTVTALNGNIILVVGEYERLDLKEMCGNNEQDFKEYLLNLGFDDVLFRNAYYNTKPPLGRMKLVHEPIFCERDKFNLFAHVHKLQMARRWGLNVGTDCHNFYPIDSEGVLFYKNAIERYYRENIFMD